MMMKRMEMKMKMKILMNTMKRKVMRMKMGVLKTAHLLLSRNRHRGRNQDKVMTNLIFNDTTYIKAIFNYFYIN